MIEFQEFPKIARLSREVVVSEKIDGTNGTIYIGDDGEFLVGSRNRWITPEDDNYGFARWATENKENLLKLGPGWHRGEWWGAGIQRRYGQDRKRFSLFNVSRWCLHGTEPKRIPQADPRVEKFQDVLPPGVELVPVLYRGAFDTPTIEMVLSQLATKGSVAAPGFTQPEGVCIYHTGAGTYFKKTILKDEQPKGVV